MRSEFSIPYPPSVNGLFTNRKGGRCKTDRYEAWLAEAGWMVKTQRDHNNRHTSKVNFLLLVRKPDNRPRDLDNLFKAPIDLMVRHSIIQDDSLIEHISAKWVYEGIDGAKVVIEDILPVSAA